MAIYCFLIFLHWPAQYSNTVMKTGNPQTLLTTNYAAYTKIFKDFIHWAKAWNQRITNAWEKSHPQTLHLSTSASALKRLKNQRPNLENWAGTA